MSNFEYLSLNSSHDLQIRTFYESVPTSGGIRFSLCRDPEFFEALEVEGDDPDVFIMRKKDSTEILASIIISKRQCFINSLKTEIFYISSLRLAEQYRNRLLGFFAKAFYQHQHEKGSQLSLMTIFEDNEIARRNLLTGKGYLPLMKDIGIVRTRIFKPQSVNVRKSENSDYVIRSASNTDISLIIDFLADYGKDKTFFPVYGENHFDSGKGLLKQLIMNDIALAYHKDKIEGIMGLWDQSSFRYWKIHSYSNGMNLLKPVINLYSWLNAKPLFPSAGRPVDYRNLAMVCIKYNNQRVFNLLLDYQIKNLQGKKDVYLAYAMHESNPFISNFPIPGIDLRSRLYLTYWREDEARVASIKVGEVYIETGSL